METLLRHIRACNNAVLPGERVPVWIAGAHVGFVRPALAQEADGGAVLGPDGLHLPPGAADAVAAGLAARGAFAWRDELFDVRAAPDGPVLAQVDRGALPVLGLQAIGVHVNGLVGDRLWVARRAADKRLDPGKLDHLVAGGVAAGQDVAATLVKEAGEEAALPPALARQARPVAIIAYAAERPEGLRRDRLHCFDLELPPDFVPRPADGEVEGFELWPLPRVLEAVRGSDDFKFNVNLVLIDLFIRRGMLPPAESAVLRRALSREV